MFPRNPYNRLRIAGAYLGRRELLGALPFEIQIGITNRCNLDCTFCPRRKSRRPVGAMDVSLFERLVREASGAVDTVDLSFDGEPFLHPAWRECVGICRRHGVRAMLETNALLLDEPLSREALDSGLGSITFSLDAATAETYRRLKPSGDFERAERNVAAFLRLARLRRDRPYIQIQFVKTDENASEAAAFLRRWRGRGADAVHVKPMLNFAGSCGPAPALPARRPCLFLWSSLAVNWDGTVPLCCLEIEGRTLMGDARKNTLREIADSEPFREVRRLHLSGRYRDHPVCRNCDVPSVAWPFVLGAACVGDLARRKLINLVERLVPLKKL
jgi:pyruvate-formate lyase-activating enzyme